MRLMRAICRFAFGILFVLAGYLKAIDPIGTSLKIKEYLGAFNLDFMDFLSIPLALIFTVAEFIVGVAILKGLRILLFSKIGLGFISFFTLITLWIAVSNPISDCGCFGEALHLSNRATFLKNLFLLGAALLLFFQRKKFKPIATPKVEWGYLVLYTSLILFLQIYTLRNIPQIDFGLYKPGTDLIASRQALQEKEYETTFIYTKDGKEETFTLNNLPDSTWTFVDVNTVLVRGAEKDTSVDFSFMDAQGNPVENEILENDGPTFIISIYKAKALGNKAINGILALADTLQAHNLKLYIVSSNSAEETDALFNPTGTSGFPDAIPAYHNYEIIYSDYKAVISFNRSNGGLTYVNSGIIVKKWARGKYPTAHINDILEQDPEIITVTTQIDERLFAEISLFIILFLIVIIRFFSKIVYNRRFEQITHIHLPKSKEEQPTSSDSQ